MEELFDGRIYVRRTEIDPKKATLFFIHGLSGSSSAWLPYERRFQDQYNTVALDLRGHGLSYRPPRGEDYALSALADDAYRILVRLQAGPAVLVAHSLGTLVGLYLLRSHPGLFSKAILISANYRIKDLWRARMLHPLTDALARLPSSDAPREAGAQVDYSRYRGTGDWSVRRMRADISNTGLRAYLHCLNTTYDFTSHEWWRDIAVPTLVIHGERDTIVPLAHARRLAAEMPHVKLVVIPGGNHVLIINDIEAAGDAMEAFLEGEK